MSTFIPNVPKKDLHIGIAADIDGTINSVMFFNKRCLILDEEFPPSILKGFDFDKFSNGEQIKSLLATGKLKIKESSIWEMII